MGLDCMPRHFDPVTHEIDHDEPHPGRTHASDETCPFAHDDFPIGIAGTCCSLRGKGAAHELEALGEADLAEAMYEDMDSDQAGAFADRLTGAADRLERTFAGKPKPRGAAWNRIEGGDVREVRSSFDESVAEIRLAARWYEKVSKLGYGVHAWY
ncbi:MAG: hypothetical protein ACHREM_33665, partial [Polyangiales bacterium]